MTCVGDRLDEGVVITRLEEDGRTSIAPIQGVIPHPTDRGTSCSRHQLILSDEARSVNKRYVPLFPCEAIDRRNAWDMVKRRAKAAGVSEWICNHTFRATGITAYLENGGTIEKAQQIAAHESPKTTKLYDRTSDQITLDEVERILI